MRIVTDVQKKYLWLVLTEPNTWGRVFCWLNIITAALCSRAEPRFQNHSGQNPTAAFTGKGPICKMLLELRNSHIHLYLLYNPVAICPSAVVWSRSALEQVPVWGLYMEQRSTQAFGNTSSTAILIGSNSFRKCTKFSVLISFQVTYPFCLFFLRFYGTKNGNSLYILVLLGTCFMHRCLQAKRVSYPPGL